MVQDTPPVSTQEVLSKQSPEEIAHAEAAGNDDEDDETCGFCIFMKGGGCKQEFQAWSKCVDEERKQEKDFTEECRQETADLRDCMLRNKEYYAPVLEEEEAFATDKAQAAGKDAGDASLSSTSPSLGAAVDDMASSDTGDSRQDEKHDDVKQQMRLDEADANSGEEQERKVESESEDAEASGDADAACGQEQEQEGEEEEDHKPQVKLESAPYDQRFPSWNQARHCYTRYNEYHRCITVQGKSEDDPECKFYQRAYRSMCPSEWVEKWNEQRENGTWYGKY